MRSACGFRRGTYLRRRFDPCGTSRVPRGPGVTDIDVISCEIDKLRIFISDEQDRARSQCWYIRSVGNHVYIGPEPTGGTSKLTFHAEKGSSRDGCKSQWGLTGDYAEMERRLGTPNLLKPARWKRPETPAVGVVQVASIAFPTDFLGGTIPPFKSGRKRITLPLAPPELSLNLGDGRGQAAAA